MKKILLFVASLFASLTLFAQSNPVTWSVQTVAVNDTTIDILFDARIASGWHLYDLGPYEGGPVATSFTFEPQKVCRLSGTVRQVTKPTVKFDKTFDMQIGYFEHSARFLQRVYPKTAGNIKVTVEWMSCNEGSCTPPTEKTFTVKIGGAMKQAPDIKVMPMPQVAEPASNTTVPAVSLVPSSIPEQVETADTIAQSDSTAVQSASVAAPVDKGRSIWGAILEAVLWGFAALLTPCVFPMVPMTVSFFIKGSDNKRRGRFRAMMYGLFIILLYTVPIAVIILLTRVIGGEAVTADIFNWLATHWLPNILFFIVFMLFAASFFGAFEISMPNSLVNKSDSRSDRGGLGGLFFMALTLVLVSFSCTGPIVGSVLIKSTAGEFWEPIVTMLAFSVAFALPFTLLALFPSLLKNLPKSGGWLNSVKVVLGFIEVALGFKFLSVADQTYHWGLLDREVYLAIWIVVFTLLGLYLIGKIRFKNDSPLEYVSVTRLTLAIASWAFVVYMIPGMWGAPLKALSGYLPPITTQDFVLDKYAAQPAVNYQEAEREASVKYADKLHLPFGLTGYFDFEQGMEEARREGKPVFLDFTGHGCVNCREMEARVWSDSRVQEILRDDYVIIALYSDDKMPLAKEDWLTTPSGKVFKSLGKKNSHIVNTRYQVSSQPAYLLLDGKGTLLTPVRGYNLDVEDYIAFLRDGVAKYNGK